MFVWYRDLVLPWVLHPNALLWEEYTYFLLETLLSSTPGHVDQGFNSSHQTQMWAYYLKQPMPMTTVTNQGIDTRPKLASESQWTLAIGLLLIQYYAKAVGGKVRSDHVARVHLRMKPVWRKTNLRAVTTLWYNGIAWAPRSSCTWSCYCWTYNYMSQ